MTSQLLIGIDGCSSGWVVAEYDTRTDRLQVRIEASLELVFQRSGIVVAGIDMPIGTPEFYTPGGRTCDREARRLLGPRRGASVFPSPARDVLGASEYREACARNRTAQGRQVGLSKQSFHLLPKMREVDAWVTPRRQKRLREVHPELCFLELAGGAPVLESKATGDGFERRLALLETGWRRPLRTQIENAYRGVAGCKRDDVVDALVVCWSARRIAEGKAISIPDTEERDAHRLKMEIVR